MTQKPADSEISDKVEEYLRECGVSSKLIAKSHAKTQLLRDLGVYGDIAESYIDVLQVKYLVDMSEFRFGRYFPPEFEGTSMGSRLLFWLVPILASRKRQLDRYESITLVMIGCAIEAQSWSAIYPQDSD